jgi:hypothetical protein
VALGYRELLDEYPQFSAGPEPDLASIEAPGQQNTSLISALQQVDPSTGSNAVVKQLGDNYSAAFKRLIADINQHQENFPATQTGADNGYGTPSGDSWAGYNPLDGRPDAPDGRRPRAAGVLFRLLRRRRPGEPAVTTALGARRCLAQVLVHPVQPGRRDRRLATAAGHPDLLHLLGDAGPEPRLRPPRRQPVPDLGRPRPTRWASSRHRSRRSWPRSSGSGRTSPSSRRQPGPPRRPTARPAPGPRSARPG